MSDPDSGQAKVSPSEVRELARDSTEQAYPAMERSEVYRCGGRDARTKVNVDKFAGLGVGMKDVGDGVVGEVEYEIIGDGDVCGRVSFEEALWFDVLAVMASMLLPCLLTAGWIEGARFIREKRCASIGP